MRTSSTNIYLTALAIMDVLYLIFSITMGLKHYDNIKVLESYIRYRLVFFRVFQFKVLVNKAERQNITEITPTYCVHVELHKEFKSYVAFDETIVQV